MDTDTTGKVRKVTELAADPDALDCFFSGLLNSRRSADLILPGCGYPVPRLVHPLESCFSDNDNRV